MKGRDAAAVCRVLLVEDSDGDARLVQETLRFAGDYVVSRVASCREGVIALQQGAHDVALVDLSLPDSQGLATATTIVQAAPDVPIIVLTGTTGSAIAVDAIRAGAQDYLAKDQVDGEVLMRSIRYSIERMRNNQKLGAAQRQLVEASRVAGMAEVAISVLHNVGNVLNSVNVSSHVVVDILRSSKLEGGLDPLVQLIKAHEQDAATFWVGDQGRKVTAYLEALASELAGERGRMLAELGALVRNIDHIKVIVSAQQAHARSTAGTTEILSLREVIEDALRMNDTACGRHDIAIVTHYDDLPMVSIDRHRLMQVLMNLLANAHHAVMQRDGERRIGVRLARKGGAATISVSDSGVGIARENMNRIFVHGYTTKVNGHGFGLHSSALAASVLGGSLTCHSDGVGKGATFTLELPLAADVLATELTGITDSRAK